MDDAKALAAKLRRAAYLAATDAVEPGRTMMTVLRRLEEVDFMFDEFARFILTGKKGTPDRGNEPNQQDRSEVAGVSSHERVGDDTRNRRCKEKVRDGVGEEDQTAAAR